MRSMVAVSLFLLLVPGSADGKTKVESNSKTEFVVCHVPPGNPEGAHTIVVGGRNLLKGHLRHGDTMGPCDDGGGALGDKIALLFVGHGEPATAADGDVPITLADGTPFGPHAASLGVPPEAQYTEWAAAYEEIATAMTYIFDDSNGNGVPHEVAIVPEGDVPAFFVWPAFHASIYEHYQACDNYSPHNDWLRAHVESLNVEVCGEGVDAYLAYLDAVPRIRDVIWEITRTREYRELVVVPMLLADSTHTQEVDALVEESAHLLGDMEWVVTEPFFEVPFVQRRFRDATLAMAHSVRAALPPDVPDFNIGVVLASHGSPYVPALPEFGWKEGEIYSDLVPTEDAFHDEIAERLPWMSRTGRMAYSSPTIEQALAEFEADGFTHVMVIPSAFPTPAIHTMWDVAVASVGRAVLPQEGVVTSTRPSGMQVYYTSAGLADFGPGLASFRDGLDFMGVSGVMEALKEQGRDDDYVAYTPCEPGVLCVTVSADDITGGDLQFMLYETTEGNWPQAYEELPAPGWVVIEPPPMPEQFPVRLRIPLEDNLLPVTGGTLEGARLGLAIASTNGPVVEPTDARGFSVTTVVHHSEEGMDFGAVHVAIPPEDEICLPGEICVTVTAQETTGPDIKMLLYIATDEGWPQEFLSLPTPSWVVTETTPVPETFPIHIRINLLENLYAFTSEPIEGARLGLAVVTGVASNFIVDPTDARGFSASTLVFETGAIMNYGDVELTVPEGLCEVNPYNPWCLSGALLWEEHMLGEENFVPGAIYMDFADLDSDGINDLVMVGEPHFEDEDLPLTALKLGVYYMNDDLTVRETEIIDQWSEADPMLYSPWGVNVIEHGGEPMIVVGTNIPELAPLEDGTGRILSYRRHEGSWVREVVRENPDPTVTNYNAMIVVSSDIDNDGDEDLALSGAFGTSAIGSWMENTGNVDTPWIPHLQPMEPGTDPYIRGTLAYKSVDLNFDGYPEVMYNAMFDVANTDPPQFRGEIWLAVNPGPQGWDDPWQKVVIDLDNWASADMWFHDFDGDGYLDLVANQIFDSTVTVYRHPGTNLADPWVPEVIISNLASPSDMWLADMDNDGLMDVVSADHTAHRGVWHKNPGPGNSDLWEPNLIFPHVLLPGDFAMMDADGDGDLDWIGTSVSLGQGFIVEQVQPESSLVATLSVPDDFDGQITTLMLTLASNLPVTGPPAAVLATIENVDNDGDGIGDVDRILNGSRDLTLTVEDVGLTGDYHVVAVLFMEGGGVFAPVPGIDYMASSERQTFGAGQVNVTLDLELIPTVAPSQARRSQGSKPRH